MLAIIQCRIFCFPVSVGVTLEVRIHRFTSGVKGGGEAEKILGYVARGGESENGGVEPRGPQERAQIFF